MQKEQATPISNSLAKKIHDCTQCSLCDFSQSRVLPKGPSIKTKPKYRILFVGNSPSIEDAVFKKPFTSKVGFFLKRTLRSVHIDDSECWFTHAIQCAPFTDEIQDKVRAPNKTEWKACSRHLKAIIDEIKPEIIIALGKIADTSLTHLKVDHFALEHPATILSQGGEVSSNYIRFLLKLQEILRNA